MEEDLEYRLVDEISDLAYTVTELNGKLAKALDTLKEANEVLGMVQNFPLEHIDRLHEIRRRIDGCVWDPEMYRRG